METLICDQVPAVVACKDLVVVLRACRDIVYVWIFRQGSINCLARPCSVEEESSFFRTVCPVSVGCQTKLDAAYRRLERHKIVSPMQIPVSSECFRNKISYASLCGTLACEIVQAPVRLLWHLLILLLINLNKLVSISICSLFCLLLSSFSSSLLPTCFFSLGFRCVNDGNNHSSYWN